MKHHHCRCGLHNQLKKFHAKKLGLLGVTLMVAHLLFHVVECLVLPAIIAGFSGHHDHNSALAESAESFSNIASCLVDAEDLLISGESMPSVLRLNLQKYGILGLPKDFSLLLPSLRKT